MIAAFANYTMADYLMLGACGIVSFAMVFDQPWGLPGKILSGARWVGLALLAIVAIGLVSYLLFGWLGTMPSWYYATSGRVFMRGLQVLLVQTN